MERLTLTYDQVCQTFFLFLLQGLIVVETFAQGSTLNGVCAGVEVSLPTVMAAYFLWKKKKKVKQ